MNPNTAAHPQDFKTPNTHRKVEVRHSELPIHCPRAGESLWNSHPRVYIPLEENGGQATCIYCGTVYVLVD
jgi:uncharacterized Zn-finger protein